jgi:tetratricopeptide (TPR) repeat protein
MAFVSPAMADNYIWVDDQGVTRLSNDPEAVPEGAHEEGAVDQLRGLWEDGLTGPVAATPPGGSGSEADRVVRLLHGAVQDLDRGETARAIAALRSARRLDPSRPETYWYLALLDRRRGRYGQAARNLELFLDRAGADLAPWRTLAEQRLRSLEDERRLANQQLERGPLELVQYQGDHFYIQLDAELNDVRSDYAVSAMEFLEEARQVVEQRVGVTPSEPLGVVFYGRAAYSKAHAHRFSFQTVGFFDGRIHVSSPAHPSETLRALLFHEYTHAVFRAETGGDRPYWFNEGLAELVERASRRRPTSTRSERASLRQRIAAGQWISLRRLAPSFSGLDDESARAAYLESIVAVEWIHAHSTPEERQRLLRRLGQGFSIDQALHEMLGLDTGGLESAVQLWIESEFPSA